MTEPERIVLIGSASQGACVEAIAGAHVVDLATWEASLPENVVGPSAQPAAVAALLAGVPSRPGSTQRGSSTAARTTDTN